MNERHDKILHYSIIRALPDLLRGEMINFALVGTFEGELLIRTTGITRCLDTLLNDSQAYACENFAQSIRNLTMNSFPTFVDGKLSSSRRAEPEFLDYLHYEGVPGFFVDAPRSAVVVGGITQAHMVFTDLFAKLVLPLPKFAYKLSPSRSRAKTVVNRIIEDVDITGERVLTNVVVKDAASEAAFQVDFAYVNGKTTFGQAIDLDTQPTTQARTTDHAIANIAELQRVFGSKSTRWLNVVQLTKISDESDAFIHRLRNWGQIIRLPEDRNYLEQLIRHEARNDVRKLFSEKGQLRDLDGKGYELVVPGVEPLIEQS